MRSVTLISPLPPPFGGMGVHTVRLREQLEQRGWNVRLIAPGRLDPKDPNCEFIGNSILRHATVRLSTNDQLVHIHDRISLLTFLLARAARRARAKYIITLHSEPRTTVGGRQGLDIFGRSVVRNADAIIAVNTHVAKTVAESEPKAKVITIPAYLPPSSIEVSNLDGDVREWFERGNRHQPVLSMVAYELLPSRFGGRDIYGITLALQAVSQLKERGIPARFVLLLATPPRNREQEEFLSDIAKKYRQTLMDDFFLAVGAFAPPVMESSDAFLRPTLHDGDSVAVREALDLGIPVVASDAAPRPNGVWLHETGDPFSLAEAIECALSDQSAPTSGCDAPLAKDTIFEIERLYESVLAGSKR